MKNIKDMTDQEINDEIQIIGALIPNSSGKLWTMRTDRMTVLKIELENRKPQTQHQFTSSLYREKQDHSLEQHPMEGALFGVIGSY